MMHRQRRWVVSTVANAAELARMLSERTWTGCSAFVVAEHEEYLFLNDATSADGAQEYAITRKLSDGRFLQIESVTFSWCSLADAESYVRSALAGEMDSNDFARPVDLEGRLDTRGNHGRCHLCA